MLKVVAYAGIGPNAALALFVGLRGGNKASSRIKKEHVECGDQEAEGADVFPKSAMFSGANNLAAAVGFHLGICDKKFSRPIFNSLSTDFPLAGNASCVGRPGRGELALFALISIKSGLTAT